MPDKHTKEINDALALLRELGYQAPWIDATCTDRPDVVAVIEGKRIGIEVTGFHSDERCDTKGSPLRASQEMATRAAGGKEPAAWTGRADTEAAIAARVCCKIREAGTYDRSKLDELWLLITAGRSQSGAVVATIPFLRPDPGKLNRETHEKLCLSVFSRVYFRSTLKLWSGLDVWVRPSGWQRMDNNPHSPATT